MKLTPGLNLKKPDGTDTVDINDFNDNADILDTAIGNKVDKVTGKGLSANDYTTAEKNKLAGIAAGAQVNPGVVTTTATGLMAAADKVKLNGIAAGAQVNPGAATSSAAGLMSAADKAKLDGVAAGAQVNPGLATTSANGLMAAADKTKLNSIATGANNYTHPATHPPAIIAQDANNRFMTDAERNKLAGIATGAQVNSGVATTTANGLMAAVDKVKLNGIAAGAQVNTPLNNTVTSTSTTQAATANAVKLAYDRAQAAFQSASDGKTAVAAAITGKGVPASGSDTFTQLAAKVSNIYTSDEVKSLITPSGNYTSCSPQIGSSKVSPTTNNVVEDTRFSPNGKMIAIAYDGHDYNGKRVEIYTRKADGWLISDSINTNGETAYLDWGDNLTIYYTLRSTDGSYGQINKITLNEEAEIISDEPIITVNRKGVKLSHLRVVGNTNDLLVFTEGKSISNDNVRILIYYFNKGSGKWENVYSNNFTSLGTVSVSGDGQRILYVSYNSSGGYYLLNMLERQGTTYFYNRSLFSDSSEIIAAAFDKRNSGFFAMIQSSVIRLGYISTSNTLSWRSSASGIFNEAYYFETGLALLTDSTSNGYIVIGTRTSVVEKRNFIISITGNGSQLLPENKNTLATGYGSSADIDATGRYIAFGTKSGGTFVYKRDGVEGNVIATGTKPAIQYLVPIPVYNTLPSQFIIGNKQYTLQVL